MPETQHQKSAVFIQFAGQGVKYMDELCRLYTKYPAIQPFIQKSIAEIKLQASYYDDSQTNFFSQGLDVDRWIEKPESTPDLAYLLSSPLSHPLIYLCQISNYISVVQEGIDLDFLINHTHSMTGFSTGIIAAVLASMGQPLVELEQTALKVQAMFFWQGVRCQQSIYKFGVQPELSIDLMASNDGSPSCMANVSNLPREQLYKIIDQFSDYGIVHPAYELLPERWIVAGLPEALTAFGLFMKDRRPETEFRFIPSTIAAHCPFLTYALETSPKDAAQLGLQLTGADLKVPVWSNDNGIDLRGSTDLIVDIMTAYFTRPAFWRAQIAPLLSSAPIKYVLDFGPGAGVASLTEKYTSGNNIQVIRCTVPLGRRRLFDEVLPSLG